ncbi:MAG: hypothetical protein QOK10_1914 [Pseudonocardiales bacterium]|jgi:hypothetical protein|nr:hypothetical protein [Pseudonocardiales bacterium]
MNTEWSPPPAPMPAYSAQPARRNRGMLAAAGLLGAGLVAGAVIGVTTLSNAATPSTSSSSSPSSAPTAGASPRHDGGHGLDLSGTVTAVGSSSVTIKTASGTTTYKVTSNSDIDKNGESSLSKLVVGDVVRFSVDSSATTTIDKLHTGNESLNMPTDHGGPAGG